MKLFAFLVSLVIASWSPQVLASNAGFGKISNIHGANNGAILFDTNGIRDTPPTCNWVSTRFAIDASTTAGQAAMSLLFLAYSLDKKIYVAGLGSCGIWGDTETVLFIQMQD